MSIEISPMQGSPLGETAAAAKDFVPHDSAASGSTSEDDAVAASRAAEDSSPEDRSFDSEDESDESSGGSYSAPSEFRSDVTEAAVMATDADMHLDSASGVLQPGNSTVGLVPTARASRKTPWIGGEVLGKTMYRIEPKISFGGCGWIYRASRCVRGKWLSDVVIKVASKVDRESAHEREAHTYFVMPPHDNVLVAEEVFEYRGQLLLVLPYATGGSLSDFLRRRGPSATSLRCLLLRLDIILQVARGLEHLHANGLVHQDMKPANVLLFRESSGTQDAAYQARVSDFGLTTSTVSSPQLSLNASDAAAARRHGSHSSSSASSSLASLSSSEGNATNRGGTPAYMSPEQRQKGNRLSSASDMWSFGLILFELLMRPQHWVGRLPSPDALQASMLHTARELDCVELWQPLMEFVNACVATEPSERPTATAAVSMLTKVITSLGGTVRRASLPPLPDRVQQLEKEGRWLAFYKRNFSSAAELYAEMIRRSLPSTVDIEGMWEYAAVLSEIGLPTSAAQCITTAACLSITRKHSMSSSLLCDDCCTLLSTWLEDYAGQVSRDSGSVTPSPARSQEVTSEAGTSCPLPSTPKLLDLSALKLCHTCTAAVTLSRDYVAGFHLLCRRGSKAGVEAVLASLPAPLAADLLRAVAPSGETCLHAACSNTDKSTASLLLSLPGMLPLVLRPAADSSLPLHHAVLAGSTDVVSLLLTLAPSSLHARRGDDAQPLWLACQTGFDDIARVLIEAGADVLGVDSRNPPAFVACDNGHLSTLRLLLSCGVPVTTTRAYDQATLLFVASSHGHTDIVHELLGLQVNPNLPTLTSRTALYVAASGGFVNVVRALIRGGCALNPATDTGETPMFIAASAGHKVVVADLLKAGATIDAARHDGLTPLAAAASGGHVEVAKELLSVGADVNLFHLSITQSPLYLAARHGHTDMVRLLLSHKADATRTFGPVLPLHVAASHGHVHVCLALLASGANVHHQLPRTGLSALHLAADRGHAHVVKALLDNHADPNLPRVGNETATPLYLACASGYADVAHMLVLAGATVSAACTAFIATYPALASALHAPPVAFPVAVPVALARHLSNTSPFDPPRAITLETGLVTTTEYDALAANEPSPMVLSPVATVVPPVLPPANRADGRADAPAPLPTPPSGQPVLGSHIPVMPGFVPGAGSVWVHLKFVSWPDDPVQRQEHHETLRGPGIVIGRKVVESRSATQFPAAATFFCPRDVSVEKFLSSRFPQVLIDYDAAHSQHSIIALGNARHPEKLPTNRLLRRQEGGSWIMLPMDVPVPIMPGDEFAISPFFGFKVLWLEPSTESTAGSQMSSQLDNSRARLSKRRKGTSTSS